MSSEDPGQARGHFEFPSPSLQKAEVKFQSHMLKAKEEQLARDREETWQELGLQEKEPCGSSVAARGGDAKCDQGQ